jgi:hypothetical protein
MSGSNVTLVTGVVVLPYVVLMVGSGSMAITTGPVFYPEIVVGLGADIYAAGLAADPYAADLADDPYRTALTGGPAFARLLLALTRRATPADTEIEIYSTGLSDGPYTAGG